MNKILAMIIAHQGFRDEEYWTPKSLLEKAGLKVVTVSSQSTPAISKFGKTAAVDQLLTQVQAKDFAAVVFVGGPGASEYFNSTPAHRLARETLQQGKLLAAICSAPVILAQAGLLKGKQATVFPSDQAALIKHGAKYTGQLVEQDGQIITASGPEAATAFAQAIIQALPAST